MNNKLKSVLNLIKHNTTETDRIVPRMPSGFEVIGSETNREPSLNASIFGVHLEVVSVTLEGSRLIRLNDADVVTVLASAGVLEGDFIGRDD